MTPLVVAVAVLVAGRVTVPAASPDPRSLELSRGDRLHAAALVADLGHTDFRTRAAAHRDLRRMGRRALPALAAGLAQTDPEIRFRCELLLPRAEAEDFNARLAVFLADAAGRYEHDLPGWKEFRKLVGRDAVTRSLFAELLQSEPNRYLIAAIREERNELSQRVQARRQELYAAMYPRGRGRASFDERYEPTLADAAGVLFCEAVLGDEGANRTRRAATAYLLVSRSDFRQALESDRYGRVARKLLAGWLDSRDTAYGLGQAMTIVERFDLPGAAKYATRLLTVKATSPQQRAGAMTLLAREGKKESLPVLRKLFADEDLVQGAVRGREPIQVRDVALAATLLLTGRDPADFGFLARPPGDTARYSYTMFSFATAEDRDTAFAKWKKVMK
jgi:hypothetical protein